jgi:ABC-type multidrug transport system ATPase subunit
MKRRLSVACSLMGNPKIVLMDEPSTGLDPVSRRQLWELIISKKTKSTILLTTHAMEEADVLCDRIGIFYNGALKCIGSSSEVTIFFHFRHRKKKKKKNPEKGGGWCCS